MAMLQMQRMCIYALKKDRKPMLEMLQRLGVVEICDVLPEDNVFHKTDMSPAKTSFEKTINAAKDAVGILDQYVPVSKPLLSMLNGRNVVTTQDYDAFKEKHEKAVRIANQINACNKVIAECKAELLKLKVQAEILAPWTALDIPLNFSGTKYTKSFLGSIPKAITLEELYGKLANYSLLNIDIISSSKDQTNIFVLCSKEQADGVYDALRAIDFAHASISTNKAPSEQLEEINNQITEANKAIEKAKIEIIDLAVHRDDLLFLQDYDRMRHDKYEVIEQLLQSKNVFVLTGYVSVKDEKALEEEITKRFEAAIEFEEPEEDEDVPVQLSNNGFAQPLEWVVESFSLPGKGEVDPTMSMALFYYLLFGIMLADAGYGTLIIAACAFCLAKGKGKMELPTKNFLKMFLFCGISTIFWGVMFGSYFGDLLDVVAKIFFGVEKTPLVPALWFFPVNKPMQMLTFSFALGIIHLMTGLVMKTYQLIKQKDYISILYDAVSWMALVISSTLILLSMEMITTILGISITIPSVVIKASAIIAILSCVIIIATNGRESRNPFKRFLKGVYALYGITGYLSDVLSYSRLLALGLASGVICSVVNKMAGMVGESLLGKVAFIIIILFGHAINFAINVLGAYVHTNRLEYVEFFGKFYGGGGRSFNPFNMKTKYYKVKESKEYEI